MNHLYTQERETSRALRTRCIHRESEQLYLKELRMVKGDVSDAELIHDFCILHPNSLNIQKEGGERERKKRAHSSLCQK